MATPLQSGEPAPDFQLPGGAGKSIGLASFAGKKLVLYFYPKDDTSGCTRQAIDFSTLRAAFEEAETAVLGISPDGTDSHDRFKAKHNLSIALASDESRTVCQAYGVWVEKSMYGRKYMGVERTTYLIDAAGRIADVWRNVKVPGHAEVVLAAAREI